MKLAFFSFLVVIKTQHTHTHTHTTTTIKKFINMQIF